MHPAFSVIFFTTTSGVGYGILIWLGLLAPWGGLPSGRGFGLAASTLGIALVTIGLLASMLHLGRKDRAWRALSQWRTSWLSREGAAALATYVPSVLFAALWVIGERVSPLLGFLTAMGAVLTLVCTAMIYRSLKPIQRWCNGWVVPNYLALALMTGALWILGLAAFFDTTTASIAWLALVTVLVAGALKLGYWRFIDRTRSVTTSETATGLGHIGQVRLLDPPHTEDNYLLQEMGYRIARKHARRLRLIATTLAFAAPLLLTLFALSLPFLALLAALSASAGILVERWLFFAEAKHTVTLYYGTATA